MSKLFKFSEYLKLQQATDYLSYLINEPVSKEILIELINDKKILSYCLDYAFLTPVILDKDRRAIDRVYFDSKNNVALYFYIPLVMSWVWSYKDEGNTTYLERSYLIQVKGKDYTLTTVTEENEHIIYPARAAIYENDNNHNLYLKTVDIEKLAEKANNESKELYKYTYGNIEIIYSSLNKELTTLVFINDNLESNETNLQVDIKNTKDKMLHPKERTSINKIIAILMHIANLKLDKDFKVATVIINEGDAIGITAPSKDTIVKYLRTASEEFLDNF